jgi:peptidyl-prolyl cis-trans isomerase C
MKVVFLCVVLVLFPIIALGDRFKTVHRQAHAHHILVSSRLDCEDLKKQIDEGADFELIAKTHSTCPSGKRGGDLGTFGPGQMVAPFDKVVFNEEVGKVHGCVHTQFGYHIIRIDKRDEPTELGAVGGHAHLAEEDLKGI